VTPMRSVQPITYRGQIEAVVIGEEATVIDDGRLDEGQALDVRAMCLYAVEISAGERPGPYSDEQALGYAQRARTARAASDG
jgi:hypothetical protein